MTTEQAVALIEAIRAFTVEAPGGRPNGKAEAELGNVRCALQEGDISDARAHFRAMRTALAENVNALCVAAEGYFGGDFRKPGERLGGRTIPASTCTCPPGARRALIYDRTCPEHGDNRTGQTIVIKGEPQ